MKNIAIVITDGVGFRNFILSDFVKQVKVNFAKVTIFSCLPKSSYNTLDIDCTIIELKVFEENFVNWFFRKAKEVTHLQAHAQGNFGIQDNLNITKSKAKNPRGIATRFLHRFSKKINSENWILRYNHLQQISFRQNPITKEYQTILEKHEISILFFTHQRPPFIAPLIYAAEKLKIKTATFIFSWDNLASKGRMSGNFDYYLVWSQLMKKDLLEFYPSVKKNQIAIVGTPQFEPFVMEKYGYSKDKLAKKFDLDPLKPIVFFTCNDSSSENDPIYLELLAHFVVSNQLAKEVNLVVRTSPAETPERFRDIAQKYGFIKWNYPDWTIQRENHQEAWSQRIPSIDDLNDLKTLLENCDLNINVLSTITLDAFIFDKPVINPVFGNHKNGMFDDQKFLNYRHLINVVDSHSTAIVKNEKEYLDAINLILKGLDNKQLERKQFLNLQIGKPLKETSRGISKALCDFLD